MSGQYASIAFKPNARQMSALRTGLRDFQKEFRLVGQYALNDAVRQGKTEASRQIRKDYNIKAKRIGQAITTRKASAKYNKWDAAVVAKGSPINIYAYGGRPTSDAPFRKGGRRPKVGASVLVKRAKGRRKIPRTFVLPARGWVGAGRSGGAYIDRTGNYFIMQRERGSGRKRIRSVWGPSIPGILNNERVLLPVRRRLARVAVQRLDHHIARARQKAGLA